MDDKKSKTIKKIAMWVGGVLIGLYVVGRIDIAYQNTTNTTQDTQQDTKDTSQDTQEKQQDESATLNKPFKWYDWEVTISNKKVSKDEYSDGQITTYQVSVKKTTDGSLDFNDEFKGVSKDGKVIPFTYASEGQTLQDATENKLNKGEVASGSIAFKGGNVDKITMYNELDDNATIDIK